MFQYLSPITIVLAVYLVTFIAKTFPKIAAQKVLPPLLTANLTHTLTSCSSACFFVVFVHLVYRYDPAAATLRPPPHLVAVSSRCHVAFSMATEMIIVIKSLKRPRLDDDVIADAE